MTTVEVSPALRQAAALFELAQHLTANAHLVPVNVLGDLQIRSGGRESSCAAVVAWADSLSDARVSVSDLHAEAFVYVTGVMGVGEVTVWTTVPGLLAWLRLERGASRVPIGLESLRQFALATDQHEGR
ncbi:hypothetical protein ACQPW3_39580 [Actinosynnema sp. CA-248983]